MNRWESVSLYYSNDRDNVDPTVEELATMLSSQLPPERQRYSMTEWVAVPTNEIVAQIVGRNGIKIKPLRDATRTLIKTPLETEDPVFKVTGAPEDVQKAARAIRSAAYFFQQHKESQSKSCAIGETVLLVRVPQEYIGIVVGRHGSTIKRIKELTRTRINTPKPNVIDPAFEVIGSKSNVLSARKAILEIITGKLSPNLQIPRLSPTIGQLGHNLGLFLTFGPNNQNY